MKWTVLPQFVDAIGPVAPGGDPTVEMAVTVAQGLPPGKHVLQLHGDPQRAIQAIRVFRPPLEER